MVAGVFRLFGYWEFGKRAGPAAYSEALLASWVPPLPAIQAALVAPKPLTEEAKSDVRAFLARVYLNQQC